MKKIVLLLLGLTFVHCTSVKKHNAALVKEITVKKMHHDIDFAYKKLQKRHPKLYLYTPKEVMDRQFDSLKKSITTPLTPLEFFTRLSPVVASIKQGHTFTYPPTRDYPKKEEEKLKKEIGAFSQFEFEIFQGKLYVIKNDSKHPEIKIGDELTKVNEQNIPELIKEAKSWITSDGYNTTFQDKFIEKRISAFYYFKNNTAHLKDSIRFEFNNQNNYWITRKAKDTLNTLEFSRKEYKKFSKAEKDSITNERKRRSKLGYNKKTEEFHRGLSFTAKDSCTAVMRIKSFTEGNYSAFYKESFELIKKTGTQNLIIDLRNNFGGRLNEIEHLYSYLTTDSTFVFSNPSLVNKKTSLFHNDYFKGSKPLVFTIKTILSPVYYSFLFFKVKKGEDGKYYYGKKAKPLKINENAFNGKVYVLINGGSFSASSILSTKLKSKKRATFVGEETGGEYNGTVAGFMPILTLPNSKIKIRMGLMYVNAPEKTTVVGHGIYPDITIIPTLENRLKLQDPEMEYILTDIKNNTQETE